MSSLALSPGAYRRIRQKINQREATTGRHVSKQYMQTLMSAELDAAMARSTSNRRVDLQEQGQNIQQDQFKQNMALRRKTMEQNAKSAKASGVAQLLNTAATGAYLLKDTTVGKGVGKALTAGAKKIPGVGNFFEDKAPAAALLPATTSSAGGAGTGLGTFYNAPGTLEGVELGAAAPGAGAAGAASTGYGAGTGLGTFYNAPGTLEGVELGASATGAGTAGAASTGYGAGSSAAAGGAGEAGAAGGSAAAGGAVSYMGAAGAAGLGRMVGGMISDGSTGKDIGGIAAGAMYGAAVAGPVGAVVGGAIGAAVDVVGHIAGTVICTELYRQRYISKHLLRLTSEYCANYISQDTYNGYMLWAPTVVRKMKKSKKFAKLVSYVGIPWVYEMASRCDKSIKGNLIGKSLLTFVAPICTIIGKLQKMRINHGYSN